jgi:hypothetical protein
MRSGLGRHLAIADFHTVMDAAKSVDIFGACPIVNHGAGSARLGLLLRKMGDNRMDHFAKSICASLMAGLVAGCNTTTLPPSDPNPPMLSWTMMQVNGAAVPISGSSPAPIQIVYGQKYNIGVQADNPGGIKQITLDGAGVFTCSTLPDSNGLSWTAPTTFPVSLPHQQADLTPDPQNHVETHQSLVLVSFDYSSLSCGHHSFNGPPPNLEYFVTNGVLTLKGTSSNYYGKTSSGQLQLTR